MLTFNYESIKVFSYILIFAGLFLWIIGTFFTMMVIGLMTEKQHNNPQKIFVIFLIATILLSLGVIGRDFVVSSGNLIELYKGFILLLCTIVIVCCAGSIIIGKKENSKKALIVFIVSAIIGIVVIVVTPS